MQDFMGIFHTKPDLTGRWEVNLFQLLFALWPQDRGVFQLFLKLSGKAGAIAIRELPCSSEGKGMGLYGLIQSLPCSNSLNMLWYIHITLSQFIVAGK